MIRSSLRWESLPIILIIFSLSPQYITVSHALDVTHINPGIANIKDLKSAIYTPLGIGGDACIRLLHRDGTVGCAALQSPHPTANDPIHGPLFLITNKTEHYEIPFKKSVVVLPPEIAGHFLLHCLNSNSSQLINNISGVLIEYSPLFQGWNPAPTTPLAEYYTHPFKESQYAWNRYGTGLVNANFPFPIFQLSNTSSPVIHQRAIYNMQKGMKGALNMARMKLTMSASGSSVQCIGDGTCLPLGGSSVMTTLPPIVNNNDGIDSSNVPKYKDTILVIAQMDASGLFHDMIHAADAPLSGLIALMAAVEILGGSSTPTTYTTTTYNNTNYYSNVFEVYDKRLVFVAMAGDPWSLMGSRRFLYELYRNQRNTSEESPTTATSNSNTTITSMFDGILSLDNVKGLIEIGQIGRADKNSIFYLHTEKDEDSVHSAQPIVDAFIDASQKASATLSLLNNNNKTASPIQVLPASNSTPGLPPSSSLAFRKVFKNLPAVVFTEYNEYYIDREYDSQYDSAETVHVDSVVNAAVMLAHALHALALDTSSLQETSSSPSLISSSSSPLYINMTKTVNNVNALLDCIVRPIPGMNCILAQRLFSPLLPTTSLSHYIGTLRSALADPQTPDWNVQSDMERFIWNYFAFATSAHSFSSTNTTNTNSSGDNNNSTMNTSTSSHTVERENKETQTPPLQSLPLQCRPSNATLCPIHTICAGYKNSIKGYQGLGFCLPATVRYIPSYSTFLVCDGCNGTSNMYSNAAWKVINESTGVSASGENSLSSPMYFEMLFGFPPDPIWVESNWPTGTPFFESYLEESENVDSIVLGVGIGITVVTCIVVLMVKYAWNKRMKQD